jgi:hypothetical protein
VTDELHRQVAGEAIGAFDDDPVAGDTIEHCREARALGHRIGTAHHRVVEFADELEPSRGGASRSRESSHLPPPEFPSAECTRVLDARVLASPAAWVRALRKFADRVGINSFAELRTGRGGGAVGRKLLTAPPNRPLF